MRINLAKKLTLFHLVQTAICGAVFFHWLVYGPGFCLQICCFHSDKECNKIPPYAAIGCIKRQQPPLYGFHIVYLTEWTHKFCLNSAGWWKLLADPDSPALTNPTLPPAGVKDSCKQLHRPPHQKTRLLLKEKHQDAFISLQAIKGHRVHFI